MNLDWVSGENWPVGETVTLTINDNDPDKTLLYTDFEVVGDDAQANFDYFNGNQISFDFKPGHFVTLTAGDVRHHFLTTPLRLGLLLFLI